MADGRDPSEGVDGCMEDDDDVECERGVARGEENEREVDGREAVEVDDEDEFGEFGAAEDVEGCMEDDDDVECERGVAGGEEDEREVDGREAVEVDDEDEFGEFGAAEDVEGGLCCCVADELPYLQVRWCCQ